MYKESLLKLAYGNVKGSEKKASFDWGAVKKWLGDAKAWYSSQGTGTRALIGAGGGALAGTGLASLLGGNKVTGALLGGTAGGVAGAMDWNRALGITSRDKRIQELNKRLNFSKEVNKAHEDTIDKLNDEIYYALQNITDREGTIIDRENEIKDLTSKLEDSNSIIEERDENLNAAKQINEMLRKRNSALSGDVRDLDDLSVYKRKVQDSANRIFYDKYLAPNGGHFKIIPKDGK